MTAGGGSITPPVSLTNGEGIARAQWVLGTQAGTHTATATVDGLAPLTFTATTSAAPIASVVIGPDNLRADALGATAQLQARALDSFGNVVATGFQWSSSDSTIATVNESGLVTAIGNGTAQITAIAGGKSDAIPVRVQQIVGSVVIAPASRSLRAGSEFDFDARALDGRNNEIKEVKDADFDWRSSSTAVASVDRNGEVTARAPGSAQITATFEGKRGQATISVNSGSVESVTITPATLHASSLGATGQLRAEARDGAGNVVADGGFAWKSLNTDVATVSQSGEVTAKGNGTTEVVATIGGKSASARVTVRQEIARVSVSAPRTQLRAGETLQLDGDALDARSNPVQGAVLTWTSSDNDVASVDRNGRVTGRTPGPVTITASYGEKSEEVALSVSTGAVASIEISPATLRAEALGQAGQLAARAVDASGNEVPANFTWSSSNDNVATVDASGLVRSTGNGSARITASADGKSDAITVTVKQIARRVDVRPAQSTIRPDETVELTASAFDANGVEIGNPDIEWVSSDRDVATVGRTSGRMTGVGPGTATITATVDDASGTATVTVQAPEPVASVSVSPSSRTLAPGETAEFTATPRDRNGDALSGRAVEWASSDPTVASVNQNGQVTGVLPGNVTIMATSEGETGRATVEVVAPQQQPAGLVIVSGNNQQGHNNETLEDPLTVRVLDGLGNPVPGVLVRWSTDDGSLDPTEVRTNQNGEASTRWKIFITGPDKEGKAIARVDGLPEVEFRASKGE